MTKSPKISARSDVPPFRVMDVMSAAAALEKTGRSIVHMEVGEPGFHTPERVIKAAERAMSQTGTGYTLALGLDALRDRIAAIYAEDYGLEINPDRVIVTTGSSSAFTLSFLACFDIADRVAIGRPGYPAYGRIMQALGIDVVEIETTFEEKFQPSLRQVSAIPDLSGLLIASPANPTGTMLDEESLGALCTLCGDRGMRLISDEIYHRVTYDAPAQTALQFNDDAVVINSFSKYYCMTGWRIGWMVVPEDLIRPVERLSQNFFISPPTPSQYAALEIFSCRDVLDERVAAYARNRDKLLAAFSRLGLAHTASADGAFYLYADISALSGDSEQFCRDMLNEAGVAAVPGIDFDSRDGHRYVRFSYSIAEDAVAVAIERLRSWLPARS